jgi:hypothetical protein
VCEIVVITYPQASVQMLGLLGLSYKDAMVGVGAALVISTPVAIFWGKDKLNEQPLINEVSILLYLLLRWGAHFVVCNEDHNLC